MSELSEWTGVSTRGSESVFNIKSRAKVDNEKKFECFNCGGNHSLKECPHPRNEERITENRRKYQAGKRKGNKKKKKSGKYSGPKPDEHGRRIIDGKLHYYHHGSNRWKLVDRPDDESKAPLANVSTNTGTTAGSTLTATVKPPPQSTDDPSTADDLLKLANVKKQFKSTLQGLITQLE